MRVRGGAHLAIFRPSNVAGVRDKIAGESNKIDAGASNVFRSFLGDCWESNIVDIIPRLNQSQTVAIQMFIHENFIFG